MNSINVLLLIVFVLCLVCSSDMVMMTDLNSLVGFMWFGASCHMSRYYARKFVGLCTFVTL